VTELVVEFSSSAYMTDTQLSRLKRIPDPAKPRFIVLGSTDPELHGHKLIDLYVARFQIEFLFRDSQQFTGLLDCPARAEAA
jgi:hypothetical protein